MSGGTIRLLGNGERRSSVALPAPRSQSAVVVAAPSVSNDMLSSIANPNRIREESVPDEEPEPATTSLFAFDDTPAPPSPPRVVQEIKPAVPDRGVSFAGRPPPVLPPRRPSPRSRSFVGPPVSPPRPRVEELGEGEDEEEEGSPSDGGDGYDDEGTVHDSEGDGSRSDDDARSVRSSGYREERRRSRRHGREERPSRRSRHEKHGRESRGGGGGKFVHADRARARYEKDVHDNVRGFEQFRRASGGLDEQIEKTDLLHRLAALETEGFVGPRRMTFVNSIDELRYETYRLLQESEKEKAIKGMQKTLVSGAGLLEYLNKRYDPFGLRLESFSRSVLQSIDDFKPSLLGIHSMMGARVGTGNPVIGLIWALISALAYHHLSVVSSLGDSAEKPLTEAGKVITRLAGGSGRSGTVVGRGSYTKLQNPFGSMVVQKPAATEKMAAPPSDESEDE